MLIYSCWVASNLSCVGLAVDNSAELDELLDQLHPDLVPLGEAGGVEVLRWEDPSGARLILGVADGTLVDLLPSFAGRPGALLRDVQAANDEVARAAVVDESGEQLTALAVELEQRRLLANCHGTVDGPASVIALGLAVSVHADEVAFAASDASLLDLEQSADSTPPPHFVENGWPWPPRVAARSIFSYGVFGEPETAQAYARLAGIVLDAQRRTVTLTGQEFITTRVQSVDFEIDVCLPADYHTELPKPGQIIAGEVFLVASMDRIPSHPPLR